MLLQEDLLTVCYKMALQRSILLMLAMVNSTGSLEMMSVLYAWRRLISDM